MPTGRLVLVTGGAGYFGSVLVRRLLAVGYRVRVLDKLVFGDGGLEAVRGEIEVIRGDIMDPPPRVMEGVFGVLHLAGLSSQGRASYQSPRYTDRINHLGTEIVARLAKSWAIPRFVFASSCSIYCTNRYTPAGGSLLFREADRVDVFGPYAVSKRAAEEALLELADRDFRPVILRKGTLYGFSPKMRYDLVLNAFTKDAFRQGRIVVNAGGEMYRPMVDIQDAAAAYLAALEQPIETVGGQIFNVVGMNRKIIDLAKEFQSILRAERNIEIDLEVRAFEVALDYQADASRFREVFRLAPSRTVGQAIGEIWQALARGQDPTDPRYYNDLWHEEALRRGLL